MTPIPKTSRGSTRAALLVAIIVLVLAAGAAAIAWRARGPTAAPVVEYPMLVATDMPVAVAPAADGTVWFSIDFSDAIGRVRDGKVERIVKPGKNVDALGLAVDAQGNAWYADAPATSILRIGRDGAITATSLGTPIARLGRMTAGPDGSIWFAESTAYSVTRLKDGRLERHEIQSARGAPFGVAVAPDGTVWSTLQAGNALLRIGPDGVMEEIEIPTRGAGPTDIAIAPDGAVWFLQFRTNQLGRYAGGKFTTSAVPEGIGALSGLATTADGSVWCGAMKGAALVRLRGEQVDVYRLPREDAKPFSLAADGQGRLWYADIRGFVGVMTPGR